MMQATVAVVKNVNRPPRDCITTSVTGRAMWEQRFSGEAAEGDEADAHQVYIALKIEDLRNGGCGCAAKNHNADLVLMSLKI